VKIIAFVWPELPRYKQHFDATKPLFRLSASGANGAQFEGKIGPVSRDNLLELACDLRQVSAANDGSLYVSTVYPCRKMTRSFSGKNISRPQNPNPNSRGSGSQRRKWKLEGGRIAFHKIQKGKGS
jgi:hypothetical protein